jgi:hypothetical protein
MSSTQLAVLAFLTIYYQAVHARPAYPANHETPLQVWRVVDQAQKVEID